MEKINIATLKDECKAYQATDIIIVDDIKNLYEKTAPQQLLVECYLFGIILQGTACIIVDDVEYTLETGSIFGCNPRNVLEKSMVSIDLKAKGFIVSPEYVSRILKTVHVDWSSLIISKTHEIIHANQDEVQRFGMYVDLLRSKLSAEPSPYKQESIDLLIQSMGLEIFDIRSRRLSECRKTEYSPAENIVQRFLMMLTESRQEGKPYLNVNGYAEQLNITPKYFSKVCKNITGKSASEIINEDIISTATALLHDNNYNIKQIASRLGFANQSHFGTFFRKHTGKSPQSFKRQ